MSRGSRRFLRTATAGIAVFVVATTARAELPPIPESLLGISTVACLKVAESGEVADAFLIQSTGDPSTDKAVVEWVMQLRWPVAKEDDKRGEWWPMPVSFSGGTPPVVPETCAPAEAL